MSNPQNFPQKWILIRGLTRSHFHWFDFKNNLQKEFNLDIVYTPELLGNGELWHQSTPKNIAQCLESLRKQLPLLNGSVGIIGISLGGMLATEWAVRYPNEVSHLVLINTSSSQSPFYHRFKPQLYFQALRTILFSSPEKIEKFILNATSNTEHWKSVFEKCIEFQKTHPVQISNFIQQLKLARLSHFDQKPNCKVLILTAKKDRLVNFECSLKIAKRWDLKTLIHPTAGHDLPLDDSKWILDQIKNEFRS
jgi:pimeloyl-ACP methyl ester carboxylesterase